MQFDEKYLPAITTLLAALIGAIVSFIVTVLSKEQKISEFRQQWIDSLRSDIAEYVAQLGILHVNFKAAKDDDEKFNIEKLIMNEGSINETFVKIGTLVNRIRLRLNPEEHQSFNETLRKFESYPLSQKNWEDVTNSINEVMNQSQAILKKEWEVVKAGEKSFKRIKKVSKISALTFMTLIIAAVFWSFWN